MEEYRTGRKVWGVLYPILLHFMIQIAVSFTVVFVLVFAFYFKSGIEGLNEYMASIDNNPNKYVMHISFISAVISLPIFYSLFRRDIKKTTYYNNKIRYEQVPQYKFIYIFPLAVCACMGFSSLISVAALYLPESFTNSYNQVSDALSTGGIFIRILILVLLVPIVEELVFRGLVYKRLTMIVHENVAVIVSSLLFGVYHGNVLQGLYAFILGCLMAFVYQKYKSIWAPVIFHMTANGWSLYMEELDTNSGFMDSISALWAFMTVQIVIVILICIIIEKTVVVKVLSQE